MIERLTSENKLFNEFMKRIISITLVDKVFM